MCIRDRPFTLWLLYSFFKTVPKELDESALIDGCSYFQAFRHIIMPVMWPGVITAGLFSLMLAYNDFTVTALLLNQENHTMVPKIQSYLGTNQHEGNLMWAVSAVVSISLFLGTLGAYALSRSTYKYTFWILIAALIFRAMPHITLVSGYLFPFFQLQIWGILPTTIVVLVAINQPFTLWLLIHFLKLCLKN